MNQQGEALLKENLQQLTGIAEKLRSYHVVEVNLVRVIYFLAQFETHKEIDVMIRLLDSLEIIDSAKMTHLLKVAYQRLDERLLNSPLLCSFGTIQDSSSMICYDLLKHLFSEETEGVNRIGEINSLGSRLDNGNYSSIVFFDDNITSGTQAEQFFDELMGKRANLELIHTPLTPAQQEKLKRIPVRICYAIQLTREAEKKIEEIRNRYSIDLEISCGKYDFDNHVEFGSKEMESMEEAKFTQGFIRNIAAELFEEKGWDKTKTYGRLLGYGNLGKLTAFYYNVPKSLLPILWKWGKVNGRDWIPLLPEQQEKKKMNANHVEMDYKDVRFAESIIHSGGEKRKPDLYFGMFTKGDFSQSIDLIIPDPQYISTTILDQYQPKLISEDNRGVIVGMQLTKLDDEQFGNYLEKVRTYNTALTEYVTQVKERILFHATVQQLEFIIQNEGDASATGCTVRLSYNSADIVISNKLNLDPLSFEMDKPEPEQFLPAKFRFPSPKLRIPEILHSKPDPVIELGVGYILSAFADERVGHHQDKRSDINIYKINGDKTSFEVPYTLTYEENGRTEPGNLQVNYTLTNEINREIRTTIDKLLDKYFSNIAMRPRSAGY